MSSKIRENSTQFANFQRNSCDHHVCWSVIELNDAVCIPCVISYLENEREPLCRRRHSLLQLLESIKVKQVEYMQVFDAALASYSLNVFLQLYSEINDTSLKLILKEVLQLFCQKFGDEILQAVSSSIIKSISSNCKGCLLILMSDLIKNIPQLVAEILKIHKFVEFLIQQLGYHDNKEVLLQIFAVLLSDEEACSTLNLFQGLSNIVVELIVTLECKQATTITQALQVLYKASNYPDFLLWISIDTLVDLFGGMKRIFLFRSGDLTQVVVECLTNMINLHCDITEHFLNAYALEFVFDALIISSNERFISAAYDLIHAVSCHKTFFTGCHAIHCFDSIAKSLNLCLSSETAILPAKGYNLLKKLLLSNMTNVPILQTLSEFDQVLQVITDGLACQQIYLINSAVGAAFGLLKNLPQPTPYKDVIELLKAFHENPFNIVSQMLETKLSDRDKEEVLTCICQVFGCLREIVGLKLMGDEQAVLLNFLQVQVLSNWIPLIQGDIEMMMSCDAFEIFLSYVTCLLRLTQEKTSLLKHLVVDFLVITMQRKTSEYESINEVIVEFWMSVAVVFFAEREIEFDESILLTGFQQLSRNDITVSLSQFEEIELFSCYVVLLAILTWNNISFLPPENLLQICDSPLLAIIPMFVLKSAFLLIADCQKDHINPVVPHILKIRLQNADELYLEHSSVVSAILQTKLDTPQKTKSLLKWISKAEVDTNDPSLQHIMGLVLLNTNLVSVIMEALEKCESQSQSSKLVLVIAGAFDYSAESFESGCDNDFMDSIQSALPDLAKKHLNLERVKSVPTFVTISVFELLQTAINSTDDVLLRHKILRQVLSLLGNGLDHLNCDEMVTNISLEFINRILVGKQCAADFSLVAFHASFLATLQNLTQQGLTVEIVNLISTLVQLQAQHDLKIDQALELDSKVLLEKSNNISGDDGLQSSCILLWSQLFEESFNSAIFKFKTTPFQFPLFYPGDVNMGPLDRDMFLQLWFHVLNASAKGYPGIQENANRCVLAMLTHTRTVNLKLFHVLTGSPWLQFALSLNRCENEKSYTEKRVEELLTKSI